MFQKPLAKCQINYQVVLTSVFFDLKYVRQNKEMGSYFINLISKWLMTDHYNHLCMYIIVIALTYQRWKQLIIKYGHSELIIET